MQVLTLGHGPTRILGRCVCWTHAQGISSAIGLRTRYAWPGTDVAYGLTGSEHVTPELYAE
eukprot:3176268-Rhodomonas_salina.4